MSDQPSVAARLCEACGMCCNGDLFHAVTLQPGDSVRELTALGLKLRRKKGVHHFFQPCSAHTPSGCSIYTQRPERCRLFHCQQLRRVANGEIAADDALTTIQATRARIATINALIDQLAETNPRRSLAQRCASALTTSDPTPLHHELEKRVAELNALLDREFRPK